MKPVLANIVSSTAPQRASGCDTGNTTLNTATHGQTEYPVDDLGGITIFFDAVLTSAADIHVTLNKKTVKASWDSSRSTTTYPGIAHGSYSVPSVSDSDSSRKVTVSLVRDGTVTVEVVGRSIGGCGENGMANYNAWVGTAKAGDPIEDNGSASSRLGPSTWATVIASLLLGASWMLAG